VRRALSPEGVLAQWIPFYGQGVPQTRAMVRAALAVFPEASLWLIRHDGILLLQRRPFRIAPDELQRRIEQRRLGPELTRLQLHGATDLLALFLLGPDGLRRWVDGAPLLIDDRPFLEFSAARALHHGATYVPTLASLHPLLEDPARYAPDAPDATRERLAEAARVRRALLEAALAEEQPHAVQARVLEASLRTVPGCQLLRARYRALIFGWLFALERQQRPRRDLEAVYRRGLEHDPEFGEAAVNLAVLYAEERRFDEASRVLQNVRHVGRTRGRVEQLLQLLEHARAKARP
jgi:hypothetical protein